MAKYFVPGLSKYQRDTFEQIAIGNDSFIRTETAKILMGKGLIERISMRRGIFSVYRYQVPIPIHMAWCEWCRQNVKEVQ